MNRKPDSNTLCWWSIEYSLFIVCLRIPQFPLDDLSKLPGFWKCPKSLLVFWLEFTSQNLEDVPIEKWTSPVRGPPVLRQGTRDTAQSSWGVLCWQTSSSGMLTRGGNVGRKCLQIHHEVQ